jgi:hypothetical protein
MCIPNIYFRRTETYGTPQSKMILPGTRTYQDKMKELAKYQKGKIVSRRDWKNIKKEKL